MQWAVDLLQRERADGRLKMEPPLYANLITGFDYLETSNRRILDHGWVNFPLGLAVYLYYILNYSGFLIQTMIDIKAHSNNI